ncbi:MAG: TylF/MycF/NovP-related O-methyltransferase [Candidatus Omnitrophota bacterium]
MLDQFYDKVVPGGFIVLDDYFVWPGCRRALEDFLKQRRLEAISLSPVGCSAFFQKP